MDRREFVQRSLAGLAGAYNLLAGLRQSMAVAVRQAADFASLQGAAAPPGDKLFPTDLQEGEWAQFPAAGFAQPACGFIRRHTNPATYGMPLGSIDTGCLGLETDGSLGLCSIFNSFVPMRGPLKLPFLGLGISQRTWLYSTVPFASNESLYWRNEATPSEIHYWGHFPVADLEYETPGSPVSVGLRAWSPFFVGDSKASNTPGIVFEVHLRNTTSAPQEGKLVFSFPGPTQEEVQIAPGSLVDRMIQAAKRL